ncbi:MAG TPA: conjugative transposon protein TraK [Puia sp.]
MFEKTRNIERSFQHIRLFCIILVTGCVAMSTAIAIKSLRTAEKARSTVYVLAAGKALEAFAGSREENIPVEAKDHIRTFHEWFFSLSPDEKDIKTNTTRALYLADESAKRFYDNLKENGFYAGIIAGNMRYSIFIDSIQLDIRVYPFYFRCWATQTIVRSTSKVTRSLITEGYLRRMDRSENNPHGFQIERWNTLENNTLKVEDR